MATMLTEGEYQEFLKMRHELAMLREQVEVLQREMGEWEGIDDQWFDFHWNVNDEGYSDPVNERAYGYHVYQHPVSGQVFDLWVHGDLRCDGRTGVTSATSQGRRRGATLNVTVTAHHL